MSSLTVYIAGPMRGYPNHNFDAFYSAEKKWQKNPMIEKIHNPARMDEDEGFDPSTAVDSKEHLRSCMKRDLNAILDCNAMVMLHGWEHSEGARVEHSLATYLGMPIFYES
jgi:hypothetical protein